MTAQHPISRDDLLTPPDDRAPTQARIPQARRSIELPERRSTETADRTEVARPTSEVAGAEAEASRRGSGAVVEIPTRTPTLYERFGKRFLDVFVASAVLCIASPFMALTWLGLRLTLGKGVILSQDRVGRNGRPFRMLKFRTMREDRRSTEIRFEGEDRRQTHKSNDDPRHTPLGRFVRSVSLDEIPQLVNVLKGEMSLVGPRPELYYVAKRNGILDHPRHLVRPGLTGLFQTSGLRSKVDLSEGLHLDLAYVIDLSFTSDLRILFRTVGALIRRTGA